MTDETTTQEPQVEESAQPQEERAPEQAAEPVVEEEPKESPDKEKALLEARRDAKKLQRKLKRAQKELERSRQQVSRRYPIQPPSGGDDIEALKQEAAMFRQMQQEQFIQDTVKGAGLERNDRRLDYSSPEAFMLSTAMAKEEDLEDREAELADKEEKLEGLEDKLRADAKAAIEEAIRDIRRESGLDKVAKPTPTGEQAVETEIDRIRAEAEEKLKPLRHKGWMKEVAKIKSERDRKIREAQQQK